MPPLPIIIITLQPHTPILIPTTPTRPPQHTGVYTHPSHSISMADNTSLMMGPGMAPPRMEGYVHSTHPPTHPMASSLPTHLMYRGVDGGLTVSNVMKEIQVLKDKFKNDDEDHCEYITHTHGVDEKRRMRMSRQQAANRSNPPTHHYSTHPSSPSLSLVSPYQDLEKATVLQECRVFHDANIVTQDPRRCCQVITKLLHLLTQGTVHPPTHPPIEPGSSFTPPSYPPPTHSTFLSPAGDQLTSVETTTVFFGVTKLFQSTNSNLRRMM